MCDYFNKVYVFSAAAAIVTSYDLTSIAANVVRNSEAYPRRESQDTRWHGEWRSRVRVMRNYRTAIMSARPTEGERNARLLVSILPTYSARSSLPLPETESRARSLINLAIVHVPILACEFSPADHARYATRLREGSRPRWVHCTQERTSTLKKIDK